jgi:hypothetical protein
VLRRRLIAVGFALGSVEHAVLLILLWFHVEVYAGYPWWRHAAFTVVDGLIAYLAARRPDWLFIPLLAFLIEQILTNGAEAWREWQAIHHVLWVVVVMHVLISGAVVSTAIDRRLSLRGTSS